MTLQNRASIPTVDYQGLVPGNSVALHTIPTTVPAIVVCVINWANYGVSNTVTRKGAYINLGQTSQQTLASLDKIRSVKIDNSYCPVPMYLVFPDTGDVVTCPPYAIIQTPVLTNGLSAVLYGDGFFSGRPPTTTVEFFNGELEPLYIPSGLISKVKTNFRQRDQVLTANAAVYTSTVMNVGAPITPERIAVVAFWARGTTVNNFVVNGVTINGVAATFVSGSTTPAAGVGNITTLVAYIPFPTGTTIQSAVTLSNAANRTYNFASALVTDYTQAAHSHVYFDLNVVASLQSSNIQVIPGEAGFFSTIAGIPGLNDADTVLSGGELVTAFSVAGASGWDGTMARTVYDAAGSALVTARDSNALVGYTWI